MEINKEVGKTVEEVEEFHENFIKTTFHPLFVRIKADSIESYNKTVQKNKIDLKYKLYRLHFKCIRYGNYNSKATIRENTKTFKSNCPAEIIYKVDPLHDCFIVSKLSLKHNHTVDQKTFMQYPQQRSIRKMRSVEKAEIKNLIELGSNPIKLISHIQDKTNRFDIRQSLYNLKYKLSKSSDNSAKQLIKKLENDAQKDLDMTVVCQKNQNDELAFCFVQSSQMKKKPFKYIVITFA